MDRVLGWVLAGLIAAGSAIGVGERVHLSKDTNLRLASPAKGAQEVRHAQPAKDPIRYRDAWPSKPPRQIG